MAEIENRLTGDKATITHDRTNRRTLITKSTSAESPQPSTASAASTEKPKTQKAKKPKAEGAKTEKEAKPEKPALKDIEQKVLDFISSLDHPATSNEVRDHFGFPLRAPARRIFKKLAALGYGENRKVGNKYQFFVKGKEYPPPPMPEPKAEPEKA